MTRIHKPLITKIKELLEADQRVVAAWLEGSIARGEDDDFSDIDLWVAVKDARFQSFIDEREKFAAQLGPVLSVLYPKTVGQEELDDLDSFSIIFEDQPVTMFLDVDVQKQSRKATFMKDSVASECYPLFDKEKILKVKPFNPQEVEQYARDVYADISIRFWHNFPKLIKHLARGDMIDSLAEYMKRLDDLVTLLRLMYAPEKIDWGLKDVEYDLPEDAVSTLYKLNPPKLELKDFQKQAEKLAEQFFKLQKSASKRLRAEMPKALIKKIFSEF